MSEGEIEVTIKIKEYFITQIDVKNYNSKSTYFKGKSIGKQKYVIPIVIKNEKCCMDMEVVDLTIQFGN